MDAILGRNVFGSGCYPWRTACYLGIAFSLDMTFDANIEERVNRLKYVLLSTVE